MVMSAFAFACGSRAEPSAWSRPAALDTSGTRLECGVDAECDSFDACAIQRCVERRCVEEPVVCDDGDPCTRDSCDSATGCRFEPLTADADGDNYRRPLPGFAPGDPAACGDDCNDASPVAWPGNPERCDGIDNDCDGAIDNGAPLAPSAEPPVVVSGEAVQGRAAGLTFSTWDGVYGVMFQSVGASEGTFRTVQPSLRQLGPAFPVAEAGSDTFAGPIVGRGDVFATAWEDRRDGDDEIYFGRVRTTGERVGPDVRVTRAHGLSLQPTLIEVPTATTQEYRLAWEDDRDGARNIYGQRLDHDGALVGDNVALLPAGLDPLSPQLVLGTTRIGLTFSVATPGGKRGLGFRSFDLELEPGGEVQLSSAESPDGATIVANAGHFVLAWHTLRPDSRPGPEIWGSVLAETGELLVEPKPLTEPAEFARFPALVPLGDRVLLFWSEWREARYVIYFRELTPELDPIGAATRVTPASAEAYAPLAAFGGRGEIGVLFTGQLPSDERPQVLLTSVACEANDLTLH